MFTYKTWSCWSNWRTPWLCNHSPKACPDGGYNSASNFFWEEAFQFSFEFSCAKRQLHRSLVFPEGTNGLWSQCRRELGISSGKSTEKLSFRIISWTILNLFTWWSKVHIPLESDFEYRRITVGFRRSYRLTRYRCGNSSATIIGSECDSA